MISGALGQLALGQISSIDAAAAGALLSANITLLPGVASGAAAAPGDLVTVDVGLFATGEATGAALASGDLVAALADLDPGRATGGGVQPGRAGFTLPATWFVPAPRVAARVRGAFVEARVQFIPGGAKVDWTDADEAVIEAWLLAAA